MADNGNGQTAIWRSIMIAMIPLAPTAIALVIYMSHLDSQVKQDTARLDSIDSGGSRLLQLLDLRLRMVEQNYDRRIAALELSVNALASRLAVMEERQSNLSMYMREINETTHANAEAVRHLEDATFGVFQNKVTPQRRY